MAIDGISHLGFVRLGMSRPRPLAQARRVVLESTVPLPLQVDGEPFALPPARVALEARRRAPPAAAPGGDALGGRRGAAAVAADVKGGGGSEGDGDATAASVMVLRNSGSTRIDGWPLDGLARHIVRMDRYSRGERGL